METLSVRLTEQRRNGVVRRALSADGRDIWWEFHGSDDTLPPKLERHDPAIDALIFTAMHHGRALHVEGPVSRDLLERMEDFTACWSIWRPDLYKQVRVSAVEEAAPAPAPREALAVAAFSGGVDASFTAWRHQTGSAGLRSRKLLTATLIQGLDVGLDDHSGFDAARASARRALDSLGVPLVVTRTNWKVDLTIDWEMEFGTAVSAVLRHWQPSVNTALIGSDEDYGRLIFPWGGNPITYAMLSTRDFHVVYDGGETTRTAKVAALAHWPEGKENLRVCWAGPRPGENCGQCEKCHRTKLNFMASGQTLPLSLAGEPSPAAIRKLRVANRPQLALLEEIVIEAAGRGISGPWLAALKDAVNRNRLRLALRDSPAVLAVRRALRPAS